MELTPSESRIYESIIAATQVGNPATFEDLRAEHYGTRPNTLSAVSRAVNSLEQKGLVEVRHSAQRAAEIVTPAEKNTGDKGEGASRG